MTNWKVETRIPSQIWETTSCSPVAIEFVAGGSSCNLGIGHVHNGSFTPMVRVLNRAEVRDIITFLEAVAAQLEK